MKKETEKLRERLPMLWPAMKGSLAKVYKPCIRQNCVACARGEKHPAWILSFSEKGRRRCLYVPLDLVPAVRQAIKTGRQLEGLLVRMASAMIQEYCHRSNQNQPVGVESKPATLSGLFISVFGHGAKVFGRKAK